MSGHVVVGILAAALEGTVDDPELWPARLTVDLPAPAALEHLALTLGDPQTHQPLQPLWDWANRLLIPLPLAVGFVCAAAWFIGIGRRRSALPPSPFARRLRTVVPYITVAVVGAAVVRSIEALDYANTAATHIAPAEAWLWVGVLTVALVIQSAALSFQKRCGSPVRRRAFGVT